MFWLPKIEKRSKKWWRKTIINNSCIFVFIILATTVAKKLSTTSMPMVLFPIILIIVSVLAILIDKMLTKHGGEKNPPLDPYRQIAQSYTAVTAIAVMLTIHSSNPIKNFFIILPLNIIIATLILKIFFKLKNKKQNP